LKTNESETSPTFRWIYWLKVKFRSAKIKFYISRILSNIKIMKTITVREMKAHWAEVEAQVRDGESFEVINRGRPTVHITPAKPRKILKWEDHLATAITGTGPSSEETVRADRDGRW
jgi:prevent-host-death family protein